MNRIVSLKERKRIVSETKDISNGGEEFVVVRLGFARRFEKDNYGTASVMVPKHVVEDLDYDTPLGKALGEVLLSKELVEWDEEDDSDFCHSPWMTDVEGDYGDPPICRCWIDDEGNWNISSNTVAGDDHEEEVTP